MSGARTDRISKDLLLSRTANSNNASILLLYCVHHSGRCPRRLINAGQFILCLEGQNGDNRRDHQGKGAARRGACAHRCPTPEARSPTQRTGCGRACARRYGNETPGARSASARTPTTAKQAAPVRGRGRRPAATAKPADGKRSSLNLSDRVLRLATGKTQQEITAACKGARPNHVGATLSRHKRAGRIEERDGKLYATHGTEAEQRAAI